MTLPPHYGDPFYRGRGRGNRGRREWLQERPMERSNGDFNRGNGHDNNMRTQPPTSASGPQSVRQEEEWSAPPIAERRNDMGR